MTGVHHSQPMTASPLPRLVMGHLEVISGPDMKTGIPYDEAVIHIEGDEDSEIEVHCPAALRIAPLIVEAVNSYEALKARNAVLEAECNRWADASIAEDGRRARWRKALEEIANASSIPITLAKSALKEPPK